MGPQSTKDRNPKDGPGQKQDPVERRRIQNRLSQRNHRRKIRDRIAKLQERVIASELRAAASLHWTYPTVPPSSDYNASYEGHHSLLSPDAAMLSNTPYLNISAGICSLCNDAISAQSVALGYSTHTLNGGMESRVPELPMASTSSIPMENSMSPGSVLSDPNTPQSICTPQVCTPQVLDTQSTPECWTSIADPPPNVCYVTPDTTLHQIIQLLNADPSQSKAIIVIQSASPELFTASSSPLRTESLESQDLVTTQPTCHCQTHAIFPDPCNLEGTFPVHGTQYTNDCQLRIVIETAPKRYF